MAQYQTSLSATPSGHLHEKDETLVTEWNELAGWQFRPFWRACWRPCRASRQCDCRAAVRVVPLPAGTTSACAVARRIDMCVPSPPREQILHLPKKPQEEDPDGDDGEQDGDDSAAVPRSTSDGGAKARDSARQTRERRC